MKYNKNKNPYCKEVGALVTLTIPLSSTLFGEDVRVLSRSSSCCKAGPYDHANRDIDGFSEGSATDGQDPAGVIFDWLWDKSVIKSDGRPVFRGRF